MDNSKKMDNAHYYRVLNPKEEPKGQVLLTTNFESPFRREVFEYRKHSYAIYCFALETGISILNAVRVAENLPAFKDKLDEFFLSKKQEYDLMQMLIDDPIKRISEEKLYRFYYAYINAINETGLFYDCGKEHYIWEFIWEMVRDIEYPNMPSRMESVFLFNNKENAIKFKNQYRDNNYQVAEIKLLEGTLQSFDMNWFSDVPSKVPLSEAQEYTRNYWAQKQTETPIIEVLFQGKYIW